MAFVAYKSSAGSGKTYTLVKEYLKIALSSTLCYHYKKILAVTFTNKAAGEMKQRVMGCLQQLGEANISGSLIPLIEDLKRETGLQESELILRANAIYTDMLHHYSDIGISTIDKFTHKIIKCFALDLHIPLSFEVLLEQDLILNKSVNELIGRAGEDVELTKFLIDFAVSRTDDQKSWNIESELFKLGKILFEEESYTHLKTLSKFNLNAFNQLRIKTLIKNQKFESEIKLIAREADIIFKNSGLSHSDFFRGSQGITTYFEKIAKPETEITKPNSYFNTTLEEDKWFGGKVKTNSTIANQIEEIKHSLGDLALKLLNALEVGYSDYIISKMAMQNLYQVALLNELEKIFDHFKREQNLVHISEFNKKIFEIVSTEPAPYIYERLGEKYSYYLIDEFQDTSIMQWQNLLPLIHNSLAEGNFNMLVGDGKQAIYRWRGGEVEQFDKLPNLHKVPENVLFKEREKYIKLYYNEKVLAKNYRSKKEIVSFNNQFFELVKNNLAPQFKNIYANQAQEFDNANEGGSVKFTIIQEDKNDDKSNSDKYLAETLNSINYFHVTLNYPLGKIAILTRNNKELAQVASYLIEHHIPIVSNESLLIINSNIVALTIQLLKLLTDPSAVIIALSIIEKVQRITDRASEFTETAVSIKSYHENMIWFFEQLNSLGFQFDDQKLNSLSLFELSEYLISTFNKNNLLTVYELQFLEEVYKYVQQNKLLTNSEFILWWEQNEQKLSVKMPDTGTAVKLLSIHKSKGLEFEVVIIPFADWNIQKLKSYLWVNQEQEKDLPNTWLLKMNKDLEHTHYLPEYSLEQQRTLLDNINILYVAFTRAKHHLHVITIDSNKTNSAAAFINSLLININWTRTEPGNYFFGEQVKPYELKAETRPKENYSLVHDMMNSRKQIEISTFTISKLNEQEKPIWFGKLLHEAIGLINSIDEISIIAEEFYVTGKCNLAEKLLLHEHLSKIFEQPKIAVLFNNSLYQSKTECEIILPEGNSIRPDKILFQDKKAIIIDFKTGMPSEKHKKQVVNYANALSQMGFEVVQKMLIYTAKGDVVEL